MPPPKDDDASVTIVPPKLPSAVGIAHAGQHVVHLALVAIGHIARERWVALARRRLRQHRPQMAAYIAGIGQPHVSGDRVSLSLEGAEANRLEQGRPQIDLRDVLLGAKVPVKERGQPGPGKLQSRAGGFYRAIPMTHGPGSSYRGGAQLSLVSAQGADLGRHLHEAAKRLTAPVHAPATARPALGSHLPPALHPHLRLVHSTDPMARLYRAKPVPTSPGGRRGRSGVGTQFRTISTLKPGGWILRPKPGADIMPELKKALEKEVPAYLEKLLAAQTQPPATPTEEA